LCVEVRNCRSSGNSTPTRQRRLSARILVCRTELVAGILLVRRQPARELIALRRTRFFGATTIGH